MRKFFGQFALWICLVLGLVSSCSSTPRHVQSCPSLNELWGLSQSGEELLFPISQNDRWGFINSAGQVVIEPKFDIVDRFSENRAPFGSRRNGKWGFIDSTGQVVVEPRFDNAYPFFGGRATIKVGERSGFIDHNGKEIEGRFVQVSSFYEGRAFGKGDDFQWRMIDLDGNLITSDSFGSVGNFSEELAAFSSRNHTKQMGFINREGQVVLKLYGIHPDTEGYGFRGGLARVYARSPFYWHQFLNPRSWGKKSWGFIDKTGKQVIPLKYDGALEFSECLATVWIKGRAGVIDTKGRMIVEPHFSSIRPFSEGLAVIQDGEIVSPSTRYGYVDKTGKVVIRPQFSSADDFREGVAVVQVQESGKKGYIDQTGTFVIEPQFDDAAGFRGGLARVEVGHQSGYINHAGALVWIN